MLVLHVYNLRAHSRNWWKQLNYWKNCFSLLTSWVHLILYPPEFRNIGFRSFWPVEILTVVVSHRISCKRKKRGEEENGGRAGLVEGSLDSAYKSDCQLFSTIWLKFWLLERPSVIKLMLCNMDSFPIQKWWYHFLPVSQDEGCVKRFVQFGSELVCTNSFALVLFLLITFSSLHFASMAAECV